MFYLISAVVVKTGRLTLATHRRIWNILLLFAFLLSGISGLLLVLRINYGLEIPHSFMLFWHVETGIAMSVISLFHIMWHWTFYKSMVAARKGKS